MASCVVMGNGVVVVVVVVITVVVVIGVVFSVAILVMEDEWRNLEPC